MRGGRTKKLDRFASKRPDELAFTERSSLLSDLNAPSRFRSGKLNQHERWLSERRTTDADSDADVDADADEAAGGILFRPKRKPEPDFFRRQMSPPSPEKKEWKGGCGFRGPGLSSGGRGRERRGHRVRQLLLSLQGKKDKAA